MGEDELNNVPQPEPQQGENAVDKTVEAAKKTKETVDNVKNIKKTANAAKTLSMSGPLMYVLFWVFVVIVAIIIITGIVMFLVTMPGMVMDKLKALFKEIGNCVAAFFGADTTAQIDDIQIYETMDYIEDMGWDLKSEGFLTKYYADSNPNGLASIDTDYEDDLDDSDLEAGYNVDEEQGVIRNGEENIILADSDFIFTYIMSDNYVYTLKNDNLNTQSSADNWWESFWTGVATGWYKIKNFFAGPLLDVLGITEGVTDKWGKGLLAIYYDDGLGKKGNFVNENLWNWDSVEIDPERKKLSVEKNGLFNDNEPIEFSLDGWTGRYGMPLEFLLSVHKATMMPDLAFDMASSFDTNINLYLHEIEGEVDAAYKTPDGEYISYKEINDAKTGLEGSNWFSAIWTWFDNLNESDKETVAMAEIGIDVITGESPCSCDMTQVYYYDQDENLLAKEGDKYYYYKKVTTGEGESATEVTEIDYDNEYDGTPIVKNKVADACDYCETKSKAISNAVNAARDYNFKAYDPYIANVKNHWYRDVYFVLSDDVDFVQYDYDYQAVMNERWTLYETYTDNPSDGYKYKPEKAGEFIVYRIDENGEYMKDGSGNYILYEGTFDEARGNTLYVKNVKDEYVMYTGTQEEAEEASIELYRKIAENEYKLYDSSEIIAVAKKAITLDSDDLEDELEDQGWEKAVETGVWTAYHENTDPQSTGWENFYTSDDLASVGDETEKYVKSNTYINITTTGNIAQVGEGQRAETNSKIKKMFLQNKYFRYDGSTQTAEIITELRKKHDIDYGALDDTELSKTVQLKTDGEVYKASDYAGVVVLNQDSLNAFSMLENTHTLDADYIYRDFKELIVELGYFEKEELTDETPRLLQFPVPEIGSANYSDRTIDKRENEFGTMVHSKHDIDANKKYTLKAMLQNMEDEGGGEVPESDSNTTDVAINDRFSKSIMLASSRVNNNRLQLSENSINISEVGAISGTKKPEQIPIEEFIKVNEEMCEYLDKEGYNYCVSRPPGVGDCDCTEECINGWETKLECDCACDEVHCHHTVHRHTECSLPASFEASQASIEVHDTCCNYLASWALQNVGIFAENEVLSIENMEARLIEIGGVKIEIDNPNFSYKAGDVCFYGPHSHVDIISGKDGGTFLKFNGGHPISIGAQKGASDSSINKVQSRTPDFVIRLNWGNQNDGVYEGFIGNEAVVSPVTGILLDYGTYDADDIDSVSKDPYRVNVDLKYGPSIDMRNKDSSGDTDEPVEGEIPEETEVAETREFSDKVGYARILVLNKEIFEMLESSDEVTHDWKDNNGGQGLLSSSGAFYDLVTTEEQYDELTDDTTGDFLSETVYGYKEFAEMYEKYGIAGYVLYIDGFKCELPDLEFIDSDEDKDLSDESGNPSGEVLTLDKFKVKIDDIEDGSEYVQTKYEVPEQYKLASEKASIKLNVEEMIKSDTAYSMVITNPKTYEPLKDLDELIFIKEGTVLGRTFTNKELVEQRLADGDDPQYNYEYYAPEEDVSLSEEEQENNDKLLGNYIRVMMVDEVKDDVEDIETYMKLDELEMYRPQPYVAQEGDDILLANMMHKEGCTNDFQAEAYGSNSKEDADKLNMTTGYVLINRALVDYGSHGTTIKEQLTAPNQYESADAVISASESGTILCMDCYANAELCLQWDCMYVTNPDGVEMTRDVLGQSGWCFCGPGREATPGKECFWWADGNRDGVADEYYDGCSRYDSFFCYIYSYADHRND